MKLNRFDARPVCPHHHSYLRLATMPTGRQYLRCPRKGCCRVAAVLEGPEEQTKNFRKNTGRWMEVGA